MVVARADMLTEVRSDLKGGTGDISFVNLDCSKENNCRLMCEMSIPVGCSIGEHTHTAETEYYIILEGKGLATDDGAARIVQKGDIVITKDGESHKIENTGDIPLLITAIIITY